MDFYKILQNCCICISLWLIQGCAFNEIAQKKLDNTLPMVENIRTINDVTSVGIEWKMPKNLDKISGYVIYTLDKKKNLKILKILNNPFATHYYIANLKPQMHYQFQIATLGRQDNISIKSQMIDIKTSYIDPIESVFASKNLPRQIKIFWNPHPNPSIKRYIIERKNSEHKFLKIGVVNHRLYVEFFDTNLGDDEKYTYRIIAESYENIQSLPSKSIIGYTRKKPVSIENLQATDHLIKSIFITWDIPKNPEHPITSYKIFASNDLNKKFNFLAQTQENSYKDISLKDGEIRYYKVIAVDLDGIEGEIPNGAIQGNALPLPPTPKIILATIQNQQAILKWEIDTTRFITSFKVCRSENGKNEICFDNITKNEFIDKEMKPQIKYQYNVRSIDENNLESLPSKNFILSF